MIDYSEFIGKTVSKKPDGKNSKPFKSGSKTNTVKGIINHPQLNVPAFTFIEDDSYVACCRCHPVEIQNEDSQQRMV